MSYNKPNLGLIAGQGELPLLVAAGIKASGGRVCCVGLRDQFDSKLPGLCDEFHQAGIVQLGKWIKLLQRWDINQAIMVGRVAKTQMHDPLKLFRQLPDWRAVKLWYRHLRHDHRTAALLTALADELAINGINLIDSTTYIPQHMASPGVMTANKPNEQQKGDIDFAWPLLERIVELDIGQSMAVRDRDVIAVEAVEGTSALIKRAGELCKAKGWTLLKTASATHDMRADVPTIGVETIEQLANAGAGCIALGAGRVILIDKPKVLEAANKAKIAVVGV
ncbi:MAG: UDP-2,3-diacylglucosamine diphosphatase LpxI [Planctomycetes bacterium]|nr:UDP-2,3-diacylglucosamine diphosphatase LpxI [Planctomycetota bacterium]